MKQILFVLEALADDSDLEPSFPLLFRDKQGRTLPDENDAHKLEHSHNANAADTTTLHLNKTTNVTAPHEAASFISMPDWKVCLCCIMELAIPLL